MGRHAAMSGLEDKPAQAFAILLAVAINALIFSNLMLAVPLQPSAQFGQEAVLRPRWIPRPRPPTAPHQTQQKAQNSSRPAPRSAEPPRPAPPRTAQQAVSEQPTVTAEEDAWSSPRANAPQGNSDAYLFTHDPLKRPTQPMTTYVDRMALNVQDRSIGGRLQELTRRANCMELRKALRASPESTEAIMATMKEYGCLKASTD